MAAVTGCSLAFKAPTVSVADVRLASMSLTQGRLAVSLEVSNPNRYALESQDFQYTLSFADGDGDQTRWVLLAEDHMADTVRVEGGETARVRVDVPFDVASAGVAVARLLRQGQLEYRFSGVLQAGTPVGVRRVPFDQRGHFRP